MDTSVKPGAPPLSPERLAELAAQAWALQPPWRHERKDVLRNEATLLIDGLLVEVARSAGALDVAIGEGLAALCSGDGPMRLGYSGIGDYARENLSIAGRTAYDLAKLSRELRHRPLLREAVRSGEVSIKQADAILKVAVGNAEAGWVARAKRETVAELKAAVMNGEGVADKEEKWQRVVLSLEPSERSVVEEALELAGKLLGRASPRNQRAEAICQEWLGEHPAPDLSTLKEKLPEWWVLTAEPVARDAPAPALDLRIWLAREYMRWCYLRKLEPIAALEVGVDDLTRARKIDARLKELAAMRKGWDELVCHLSMLIIYLGLWRDAKFLDVDHYAVERLGMSGKAMKQRAWLERRMWELPEIRKAMRAGRIGYEKARLVARCPDREFVEAWISMAEKMTCIELKRAVEADEEKKMCAEGKLALTLSEEVIDLFDEACRAVDAVEGRLVPRAEAFVIMCRHFIEVWKEALKERNTWSRRVRERNGGWCTVPGCSRPAAHAHHIEFKSHGGKDTDQNGGGACIPHHLHGIHKGYVRVRRESDRLVWELGEVE